MRWSLTSSFPFFFFNKIGILWLYILQDNEQQLFGFYYENYNQMMTLPILAWTSHLQEDWVCGLFFQWWCSPHITKTGLFYPRPSLISKKNKYFCHISGTFCPQLLSHLGSTMESRLELGFTHRVQARAGVHPLSLGQSQTFNMLLLVGRQVVISAHLKSTEHHWMLYCNT